MPPRKLRPRNALWCTSLGLWAVAMVLCCLAVWRHKLTPAEDSGEPPERWPAASAVPRADDRATLVMLAHPKCPCTRASIAELGRLMTDMRGRVRAHVLMVRPPGAPERWEHTDLWDLAAAIPGVTIGADIDGREARRFGATASGHVVIYDPSGRLLFRGGITWARGHEGDSTGRARATQAILHSLDDGATPTFGCELLGVDENKGIDDAEQADRY